MASSNFKLFDENKTNMMQDGEYGANNQRLNGLQSGIASSMLQNKFQYQMSLISYAIGQLMVQNNIDANDSQAVSTFVNNLSNTFLQKVIDKATTGQAQAGTDDTKWLTPALVKAFYDYRKASVEEAKAGTDQNKFITPYTLSNFVGEYSERKFYKVGDVVVTARTDLGSDWALCNGASFASSQYPELAGVMGNPSIYKISNKTPLGLSYNLNGSVVVLDDEGRLVIFNNKSPYNTFTRITFNKDFGVTNTETITVSQLNENRNGQILYSDGYFYFISCGSAYIPHCVIYKFKLDGTYFQRKATDTTGNVSNMCVRQSDDYIIFNDYIDISNVYGGYSYISKNNFETDIIRSVYVREQGKIYSTLSSKNNKIVLAGGNSNQSAILYAIGTIGGVLTHYSTNVTANAYTIECEMCSDGTRCIIGNNTNYIVVDTTNGRITLRKVASESSKDIVYFLNQNLSYHNRNFIVNDDFVYTISNYTTGTEYLQSIIALNLKFGNGFFLFKNLGYIYLNSLYALESNSALGFLYNLDSSKDYFLFGNFSNIAIPNIQLNNTYAYIRVKVSN